MRLCRLPGQKPPLYTPSRHLTALRFPSGIPLPFLKVPPSFQDRSGFHCSARLLRWYTDPLLPSESRFRSSVLLHLPPEKTYRHPPVLRRLQGKKHHFSKLLCHPLKKMRRLPAVSFHPLRYRHHPPDHLRHLSGRLLHLSDRSCRPAVSRRPLSDLSRRHRTRRIYRPAPQHHHRDRKYRPPVSVLRLPDHSENPSDHRCW